MKYLNKIIYIVLFCLSCHTQEITVKDKVQSYIIQELNQKETLPKTYYIFLSPDACITCFYAYLDYLFLFLENKNFVIVTNTINENNIIEHYPKKNIKFLLPQNEASLSKQSFIKTLLCVAYSNTNTISNVLIIDEKNIKHLDTYFESE